MKESFGQVWLVAKAECAWLRRSYLAVIGGAIFTALLCVSIVTSTAFMTKESAHRRLHQSEASDIFESQPDRHPHRMVHYGQYVFRTPTPLAAIDPGLDAYGGTSVFLEGHRQNAAMFASASEGATLVRFGALTPAFVLQVLAPLVFILIGYASITRERESGTLDALLAQGMTQRTVACGKLIVLLLITAGCIGLLTFAAFAVGGDPKAILPLVLTYAGYLGVWAFVVVAVSCLARRSSGAFIALAALWLALSVITPRLAADVASTAAPLKSAFARDMALAAELHALGDSHSANDPNFEEFRQRVFAQYGTDRPEELPVNIRGLLAVEGEKRGAVVLERYTKADQAARAAQQNIISAAGLISPTVAIHSASQTLAGTDLATYHRFLNAAEAHRLAFVQELNMLQATEVDFALDSMKSVNVQAEQATRVSAEAWARLPRFSFSSTPPLTRIANTLPTILLLALWVGVAALLFVWASRPRTL